MKIAWLVKITIPGTPNTVYRWWTHPGEITFNTEKYFSKNLEVSGFNIGANGISPVTLVFSIGDIADRRFWLSEPGFRKTRVHLVYYSETENSWKEGPVYIGRLGQPKISSDKVSVTVDSVGLYVPEPITWSHEAQIERFPGDVGFSQLASAATPTEDWP